VKVNPLLPPFAVTTNTFRTVGAAAVSIWNVAVNVVEFVTLTELANTPEPVTRILVAPGMKFVPVKPTVTVLF
jgi:hypothetical protein